MLVRYGLRLTHPTSIDFGALRYRDNTPYELVTNQIGLLYQLSTINYP